MTDDVQQAVDHYKKLSGTTTLKHARTPYCPEGSLLPASDEEKGELESSACSILMKNLWAALLARPCIMRAVCRLAGRVSKWTRNDDRRLKRLMEYIAGSKNYMLKAIVSDDPKDLELWYFADADLAGDPEDTKSISGGIL